MLKYVLIYQNTYFKRKKETDVVDEIVFLDSEIIDDDDNSDVPVGTLIGRPVGKSAPATSPSNKADTYAYNAQPEASPAQAAQVNDTPQIIYVVQPAQPATRQRTAPVNDNPPAPISPEVAQIRTGIKKLNRQNSVQHVLGRTDFDINADEKNPTRLNLGETDNTWAVANISTTNNGRSRQTTSKNTKPKAKPSESVSSNATTPKNTSTPKNKNVKTAQAKQAPTIPDEAAIWTDPIKAKTKAKAAKADVQTTPTAKPKADEKTAAKPKSNEKKTTANTTTKTAPKTNAINKTEQVSTNKNKNNTKNNKLNTEEKKMAKETTKAAPKTKEPATTETVLIEGDNSAPHGKFVIKRTENDNFVFKLFSSNKRVVAVAAGQYTSIGACKNGIQSVITNSATAPIEDQTLKNITEQKCPKWIIYIDKRGEFRLRLIASNGNMVAATNDGYLSKDAAKKGIEAIARASKGAEVVRNDDLW